MNWKCKKWNNNNNNDDDDDDDDDYDDDDNDDDDNDDGDNNNNKDIYGPSRTLSSRYCSFYLKTAKLSPLLTILNLKALLDYKWYK